MSILEKITEMRVARHWSEYQLAEKSGLTQSTISSWYRKDMVPSIPSLTKICDAFGITLSQFFLDDTNEVALLSKPQLELIDAASKLDEAQYEALVHFLRAL
ncbi:MAG: helix-turn-helix transcriptional regulator [Lachnospiraceae bacterium]|jgi:transcriptional regulator with XRE-family HTH domain|nr:helix-turn-helix transcriptional regulator [Lachnospiraceae bacterium]